MIDGIKPLGTLPMGRYNAKKKPDDGKTPEQRDKEAYEKAVKEHDRERRFLRTLIQ